VISRLSQREDCHTSLLTTMTLDDSLRLETPNEFASFPYTPYPIQLELMKALYSAIEGRKVAIMESPTGTVSLYFQSFDSYNLGS